MTLKVRNTLITAREKLESKCIGLLRVDDEGIGVIVIEFDQKYLKTCAINSPSSFPVLDFNANNQIIRQLIVDVIAL